MPSNVVITSAAPIMLEDVAERDELIKRHRDSLERLHAGLAKLLQRLRLIVRAATGTWLLLFPFTFGRLFV